MSMTPTEALHQYFGFDHFRPMQQEIVEAVLAGNDVLALMPTGGGKSLCYQVPALVKEGLCLVVSPLIALMQDQVYNLRKKNITAFAIHTGMKRKEVLTVLETASHSNCKFLFVSPERIETNLFKEFLPALDIGLIAVDEAHCISQWGYDFRPPYLRIIKLREELPEVPVIALTASATPLVQQDICEKLSLNSTANSFKIFRQSFERPKLSYSVFETPSRINKIKSILTNLQGSAIVYCKTRKRTKEISELLNTQGFSADFYNAGLNADERKSKQDKWIKNQIRVMVCTNAFGMGIDKPDVRVVIHADAPDCLENYYQEAGRAGRDGKKAYAVLLYENPDLDFMKTLPDLRYPSLDLIQKVYGSVMNYLQLPEGESPGESYDFNLKEFVKNFGLDVQTTIYGLKALEQDGWLSFSEQVFSPATICFTIYKNDLYEYEKQKPELEPLIKSLLRTYEGIYDYPVGISESFLAWLLKYDVSIVKEQLNRLHYDRVIHYEPQKDEPQVMLTRTRIRSSELEINLERFRERKTIFTNRIHKMIQYLVDESTCRSKMIGNYFGDISITNCGICDNCLREKRKSLNTETFDTIVSRIREELKQELSANDLLSKISWIPKENIWSVIDFLSAEGKIILKADGRMKWNED